MSQRLSTSVTFQNLEDRVAALEGEAALSSSKIVAALGYTPANVAGDNFVYVNAHTFIGSIEGGGGSVNASGSSVPGYTGIVEFRTIGGDRNGFVGFNAENGPMHYGSDTSTGHYFEGGLISPDPAMRFGLRFNSVDGVLDFDSGDYFYYSRVADMFLFNVGGATKASIDGGGVMSVAQLALDQEFYQTVASSTNNPLINFDSADYIAYDRVGNSYTFNIGNLSICNISHSGLIANGLSASTISLDTEFYLNFLSGNPTIVFDHGDTLRFDRANNKFVLCIGNVDVASLDMAGNIRIRGTLTSGATTV